MKASESKLLPFLDKSPQFQIPIYQRTYSWRKAECEQLWEDILRVGSDPGVQVHFIGSVVYIEQGMSTVSQNSPLMVIDGQQRLTTVILLLEALARGVGDKEPLEGFSALKIRRYYLVDDLKQGDHAYKILLTKTDKRSLLALLQGAPKPKDPSIRVDENFAFFERKIKGLGEDLAPLCRGLMKLMIVDVALSREYDNPQLIFESMNSTGRELSQADLIRNYVLMGLEAKQMHKMYEFYWRPMEEAFGQHAYAQQFDGFMRHFLTLKAGKIPNVRKVYEAFKTYSQSQQVKDEGVEVMLGDLHVYSEYFCAMALGRESDPALSRAFRDLRELGVEVAYPFLLQLYHDYKKEILCQDDFLEILRLVESYVFRRAVCSIPTNSLNMTFARFHRDVDKDRYLESVQAAFLRLPSYRRFPKDEEFRRDFEKRDLYHFRNRSYWLRRFENAGFKEPVVVDELTIEHIMPQNKNLSSEWQQELGPEWRQVQETLLHTLGNLTLTGYNSELSDRSFADKCRLEGGFQSSKLRLNATVSSSETWNEQAIRSRARQLSEIAVHTWATPSLSSTAMEAYMPIDEVAAQYTLADYPPLVESNFVRALFDDLRKAILLIDPCVHEEVKKVYIAYKAETNFVAISPQMSGLRINLSVPFSDLEDPLNLCRDVSGIGRHGTGESDFKVLTVEEIPYALGLIQQAFDRQMAEEVGV
jgi:uncharacterized protein with ParB-like and HNH nuclease domain/predicted transport protein